MVAPRETAIRGVNVQPVFLIKKLSGSTDPDERWVVAAGPAKPMFVIDAGGKTMVVVVDAPPSKIGELMRDVRGIVSSLEVAP